jgi:hypothetical protein
LISVAVGVPAWAILAVAWFLVPDPNGHGTHKQLGLGACSILAATGVPCPVCGMTTSFSYLAHLDPVAAVVAQPFGTVLCLFTLAAAVVAVAEFVRPRGRWQRVWHGCMDHERLVAGCLFSGLALGWLYKLFEMGSLGA